MFASLRHDTQAIMPISLVLIGTLSVSAILLVGIVSMSLDHPNKTKTALESIASSMHQLIHSVDSSIIENHIQISVDDLPVPVTIQLSSDSLSLRTTHLDQTICVVSSVQIPWWIHDDTSFWSNGDSFHQYLNETYGYSGTISDPLDDAEGIIKNQLQVSLDESLEKRLINLYDVKMNSVIHVEKVVIYFNDSWNSQSFILLYQ